MGLSNSFSAGIFLAVAIIHIIPESLEDFDKAAKKDTRLTYFPFIPVAICSSFMFVLLIDRVIFNSHSHEHGHEDGHEDGHEHGHEDGHDHEHRHNHEHGHNHDN